jgi:hypothetical protein
MNGSSEVKPELSARIALMKTELANLTRAYESARREGQPGRLFYLLRKKWTLTQNLFEAESQLLLGAGPRGGSPGPGINPNGGHS